MNFYQFFRRFLFRMEPEKAHRLTLALMRMAGEFKPANEILRLAYHGPSKLVKVFGLTFSNPIGLAAGYDKDGQGWRGLACLGFGHVEVGTVTLRPQYGNPKPRLFRLVPENALINRMGFPGLGAEFVRKQLTKPRPASLILGVNIGKNKDTPLEIASEDYIQLLRSFTPLADYLAINISSPNTVGLRQLQDRQSLTHLLSQLVVERERLVESLHVRPPILVKIAPDLSDEELDDVLEVILAHHMDGIIATNTTISRAGLTSPYARESGGLSGRPLFHTSLAMVAKIVRRTDGKLPVIGVGGINNADGVQKMLDAGAVLTQIYTGLIYEGPGLVKRILLDLEKNQPELLQSDH